MTKHLCHVFIFCTAIAGLVATVSVAEQLADTQVQLAADVWPPFTNHFGKPRIATELVHLALAKSGYEPTTQILDNWTVSEDLKAGKYDGCGALWKSIEHEAYLLFSKPYLQSRLHLAGRKGLDVELSDLSQLKSKRLVLVEGYAYGELVDSLKKVEIIYGKDSVSNLKMILSGDADYTLVEDLLIQYLLREHTDKHAKLFDFGSESLLINPIHLALRKDLPGAAKIIQQFNQTIRLMQVDGTYNRILRLNSISIDIDGNGYKELALKDLDFNTKAPVGGYDIFSNDKPLPPKTRYSIRDTLYNDWDEVPNDFRSEDDFIPDTRKEGFNLFGGDF